MPSRDSDGTGDVRLAEPAGPPARTRRFSASGNDKIPFRVFVLFFVFS
jgi:hypothetical protein